MASCTPLPRLSRAAHWAVPLLVAALLTLLLGWSALQEGRSAVTTGLHEAASSLGLPAPHERLQVLHASPAAESEAEGHAPSTWPPAAAVCWLSPASRRLLQRHPAPAALQFRLAPLRQPPGHAPPYA